MGCLHPHRAGLQGRARSLRAILHQPGLLSPRGCPGDGVHRILNRKSMPSSCYPSVQRWRPSALSYSSSPISAGIKIPERRGGDACKNTESLLKRRSLGPTPRIPDSASLGQAREFAFLRRTQVMLVLLVQGPCSSLSILPAAPLGSSSPYRQDLDSGK